MCAHGDAELIDLLLQTACMEGTLREVIHHVREHASQEGSLDGRESWMDATQNQVLAGTHPAEKGPSMSRMQHPVVRRSLKYAAGVALGFGLALVVAGSAASLATALRRGPQSGPYATFDHANDAQLLRMPRALVHMHMTVTRVLAQSRGDARVTDAPQEAPDARHE